MSRDNWKPSIKLDRPERNSHTVLVAVPEFPSSDPRSKIPRSPKGGQGIYRITFVLCIPGKDSFYDSVNVPEVIQSGESLLIAPEGVSTLEARVGDASVIFSVNSEGLLSTATIRLEGPSFAVVEKYAYNLIMPLLSYWSFLYDVALDTKGYEIEEEETQTVKWSFGLIGEYKHHQLHAEFISSSEHQRLFAAYREALNSTNMFYRVLSFYKVTEGVKAIRTRRYRKAGNKGKPPIDPNEAIPRSLDNISGNEWNKNVFTKYLGQEFTVVLEQLSDLIRNAVAHLDPMRDVLDADRYEDVRSCERAEPVLAYIAREMLKNEIQTITRGTQANP